MRIYVLCAAASGAVGLLLATQAQAITSPNTPLSNLLSGGTFIVNGLTFSNFTYTSSAIGAGNTAVPASAVIVSGVTSGGLEGMKFTAPWTVSTGRLDSVIGYQATSVTPIARVQEDFNAIVSGTGFTANVAETVNSSSGTPLVTPPLSIFNTGATSKLQDTRALIPPQTTLVLAKDITLGNTGGASTGFATISLVENMFGAGGGVSPAIPEPASLALVPLALLGLALRRRRI